MQIDSHFLVIAMSCQANDGLSIWRSRCIFAESVPIKFGTALSTPAELTGLD